jgi:CTP synthase
MSMLGLHDRVDVGARGRSARANWGASSAGSPASVERTVRIGITGKYAELRDAYASIDKVARALRGAPERARSTSDWIDTTDGER